eukprot:Awhi_evm1s8089
MANRENVTGHSWPCQSNTRAPSNCCINYQEQLDHSFLLRNSKNDPSDNQRQSSNTQAINHPNIQLHSSKHSIEPLSCSPIQTSIVTSLVDNAGKVDVIAASSDQKPLFESYTYYNEDDPNSFVEQIIKKSDLWVDDYLCEPLSITLLNINDLVDKDLDLNFLHLALQEIEHSDTARKFFSDGNSFNSRFDEFGSRITPSFNNFHPPPPCTPQFKSQAELNANFDTTDKANASCNIFSFSKDDQMKLKAPISRLPTSKLLSHPVSNINIDSLQFARLESKSLHLANIDKESEIDQKASPSKANKEFKTLDESLFSILQLQLKTNVTSECGFIQQPAIDHVHDQSTTLQLPSSTHARAKSVSILPTPSSPSPSHDSKAHALGEARFTSRPTFGELQKEILNNWVKAHETDCYPSKIEKARLSKQTALTFDQVNTWFLNFRKRKGRQYSKKSERSRKISKTCTTKIKA